MHNYCNDIVYLCTCSPSSDSRGTNKWGQHTYEHNQQIYCKKCDTNGGLSPHAAVKRGKRRQVSVPLCVYNWLLKGGLF